MGDGGCAKNSLAVVIQGIECGHPPQAYSWHTMFSRGFVRISRKLYPGPSAHFNNGKIRLLHVWDHCLSPMQSPSPPPGSFAFGLNRRLFPVDQLGRLSRCSVATADLRPWGSPQTLKNRTEAKHTTLPSGPTRRLNHLQNIYSQPQVYILSFSAVWENLRSCDSPLLS